MLTHHTLRSCKKFVLSSHDESAGASPSAKRGDLVNRGLLASSATRKGSLGRGTSYNAIRGSSDQNELTVTEHS